MKKTVILLSLVTFLFSCSGKHNALPELDETYHERYDISQKSQRSTNTAAVTKDGIIYTNLNFINFIDSKDNTSFILSGLNIHDGKFINDPKHLETAAKSSLSNLSEYILAYDNEFYVLEKNNNLEDNSSRYYLAKFNKDFSSYDQVGEIKPNINNIGIHRGYVFYSAKDKGDGSLNDYTLYVSSLNDISKSEKLISGTISGILGIGNKVYFIGISVMWKGKAVEGALFCYDLKDKKLKLVDTNIDGNIAIINDFVIHYEDNSTYVYNLKTKERKKIIDQDYGMVYITDDNIIIDNSSHHFFDETVKQKVYILSKDFQVVNTLENFNEDGLMGLSVGADEKNIYFNNKKDGISIVRLKDGSVIHSIAENAYDE